MKLFSKTLIYFLILSMTGNNIVGDLIKNGNQDLHHNFKVLYASHFPLNVKKIVSFYCGSTVGRGWDQMSLD